MQHFAFFLQMLFFMRANSEIICSRFFLKKKFRAHEKLPFFIRQKPGGPLELRIILEGVFPASISHGKFIAGNKFAEIDRRSISLF